MLEEKKNNYIMSVVKKGLYYGVSVCDISTGDFYATQITENNNFEKLLDEFARYMPAEIITNELMYKSGIEISKIKCLSNVFITERAEESFSEDIEALKKYYTLVDENEKEIQDLNNFILAAASINGLISYLTETQKVKLNHINKIKIYKSTMYMSLDVNARASLELTERIKDKSKKGTLINVIDKTSTSMGGRLLRRWINDPLVDVSAINKRLYSVKELKEDIILRGDIIENLKKVYDIERLTGKISYGNANARDMISLKNSLQKLPSIKEILKDTKQSMLHELYENLDVLSDIAELIEASIVEDPPISVKEGGLIKKGFNEELDMYKSASIEGKNWIIALEAKEKEATRYKKFKSWIYTCFWILYRNNKIIFKSSSR